MRHAVDIIKNHFIVLENSNFGLSYASLRHGVRGSNTSCVRQCIIIIIPIHFKFQKEEKKLRIRNSEQALLWMFTQSIGYKISGFFSENIFAKISAMFTENAYLCKILLFPWLSTSLGNVSGHIFWRSSNEKFNSSVKHKISSLSFFISSIVSFDVKKYILGPLFPFSSILFFYISSKNPLLYITKI